MGKKRKMGASNFGVMAQIWAVVPNWKIQSNSNFNVDKKKYSLVRISLIVVELFQENNQFLRVYRVVTGV